jgi:hypothetical protein
MNVLVFSWPWASAMFAATETDARRSWALIPYASSLGKSTVSR